MQRLGVIAAVLLACPGLAAAQEAGTGVKRFPGLYTVDPQTPAGLRELLRPTGDPLPLVSAHRGGPRPGLPENCLATFEDTLRHTFAFLEVDPRYTKDGAIVLHHDPSLERTTNGQGLVAGHTLAELKRLRLRDPDGNLTDHAMPTLDEALAWARGRTVLVLDQKDVPVRARVKKVEEHRAEGYAVLIVYSFADAKLCHVLNKNIVMEVMVPSVAKVKEFDRTGVPWGNVVAFVGHTPPRDPELYRLLHARGVSCLAGTSRNLDRQFVTAAAGDRAALGREYRALTERGIDLLETDLPREVGRLLHAGRPVPLPLAKFFRVGGP